MTAATSHRPQMHRSCQCGKRGWPTKFDAEQVVVNAKIMHYLHANNRRREQRTYQCLANPKLWHVTSQAEAVPLPRQPRPSPTADTIREHVEALLLDATHTDTDTEWTALLDGDLAEHASRALSEIHQAGLRHSSNLKAHRDDLTRAHHAGDATAARMDREVVAYRDWMRHWTRFQSVIVARKTQVANAMKAANIVRANSDNHIQNIAHREAAKRLALAIHHHQQEAGEPSPADRELWRALREITVPNGKTNGPVSCDHLIRSGTWEPSEEQR